MIWPQTALSVLFLGELTSVFFVQVTEATLDTSVTETFIVRLVPHSCLYI